MAVLKSKMRIFVTGGTGFIGRQVVRELAEEGHRLLLLSRQHGEALSSLDADVVHGDLSNGAWKDVVAGFAPQVSIHLAWEDLPNYDARTSLRNLNYGLNLITTLADIGCNTIICTGSCWEYGRQSGKLDEDMPPQPYNAFTAAKTALHLLGRQIAEEHGMNFIWLRLFYVYGPGQRETSLIPLIINQVQKSRNLVVKTPLNRNDFVYVGDVASAIATIVNGPPRDGVYNIGSGHSTSVQEIVKLVCDRLNFPSQLAGDTIQAEPPVDFWADIYRMKKRFGWEPKVDIAQGIQKTIEYYISGTSDERVR